MSYLHARTRNTNPRRQQATVNRQRACTARCRGRSNRQRPRPAGSRRRRRHSQAHTANAITRTDVRALALPALSTSRDCPHSVSTCAALPARATRTRTASEPAPRALAAPASSRRQQARAVGALCLEHLARQVERLDDARRVLATGLRHGRFAAAAALDGRRYRADDVARVEPGSNGLVGTGRH